MRRKPDGLSKADYTHVEHTKSGEEPGNKLGHVTAGYDTLSCPLKKGHLQHDARVEAHISVVTVLMVDLIDVFSVLESRCQVLVLSLANDNHFPEAPQACVVANNYM